MSRPENPTRDRILKSTLALLEAGSAGAVRMADIAKAAGISRQALYLHYPNRAELLVATVRYLDEINNVQARLEEGRRATSGSGRLAAWVETWGNYIPVVYGVAKALMAMEASDPEARAAWEDRKAAIREGCAAAVAELDRDGDLTPAYTQDEATDLLWVMLSITGWEYLVREKGWSQAAYVAHMRRATAAALIRDRAL